MNSDEFWRIIELLDWRHEGNDEKVLEPVIQFLANRSEQEIIQFQERLAGVLYLLDGREWARESGDSVWWGEPSSLSVDGFLYARCVVVANGPDFFKRVLEDPSAMPKDLEFESLLRVARSAWVRKTGKEWDHETRVSYETFSNRAGWQDPNYSQALQKLREERKQP